jgi:GTP diphosphokinase / guanosine-3',5'-bis(diphosphate) 3'-diphosphatase
VDGGFVLIRQFELVSFIKQYDPTADEDLINRAYVFSMKAHGHQQRASGDPYFTHPLEVAGILARLKLDTATIATALLHDTVEDTLATLEEIESLFGKEVAFLVDGVTKLSHLETLSDQAKQAEKFRKLLIAMSADIRVLLIKLADRLHNMETLHHIPSEEKRRRIAKETMDIYVPLAERIGLREIKDKLEDLCFAQLNPEARDSILSRLKSLRSSEVSPLEPILQEIQQILTEHGLKAVVSGREKTPFSIWCKIQLKNMPFEQLSDIMAFRIIVGTIPQCYQTLGILHSTYSVVPGRFKDYVSTPKQNNYQSLHTSILGPLQRRIEVQIRTQDMHAVCELGVAAHWKYKQGGGKRRMDLDGQSYHWIRGLLDILENASTHEEFLEHTKLEMFQDQVFCFSPKGDLISLPRGATPIDFAYAVHSEIGNTCVGAKVNGRTVPLRMPLENGDQIEILTSKSHAPSPTWERFVVTGKARSSIRRFIRLRAREQFVKLGKSILEKAFKQKNLLFCENQFKDLSVFECETPEDLYAFIGEGQLTLDDVMDYFHPQALLTPQPKALLEGELLEVELLPSPAKPPRTTTQVKKTDHQGGISIEGLIPGMAIHYAGCCHPVPGDYIVGVVVTGRGITIHTADCENLAMFKDDPARLLDVFWPQQPQEQKYTARIELSLINRMGALATLTALIAKAGANILNLKILNRNLDFYEFLIDLEVQDVKNLNEIIASLRMSSWVLSVERRTHG